MLKASEFKTTRAGVRSGGDLPASVRDLFWDLDPRSLRWDRDRELITGRVLISGPWETVQWLRATIGDQAIRTWIEEHERRGLSPRQLRFWQLILDNPHPPGGSVAAERPPPSLGPPDRSMI
jgi:uncharacterized protein DUF6922